MKAVENSVLDKKSEKVEKNGQTQTVNANVNAKNMEVIAKLVMQKIQSLEVDLSEISELNEIAKEVVKLNIEIQKLSEKRLQLMNHGKEIYEKLNGDSRKLLEFLGLIDTEMIEKAIYARISTERNVSRASKGNGVSGKKINFKGQIYNVASYFMAKNGIQGGFQGLEQWAKANGYSIKIENDTIYIL